MYHNSGHMNDWIFSGMLIVKFIFIASLLLLIYHIYVESKKTNEKGKSDDNIRILEKRFALGEISEEEFNQMKNVLQIQKTE